MNIKATLTRKIGPLPVYGWVAVVAGGVIIGRKLLGGSAGGTATGILGGGGAETGFGESALPVDVTGRAPTDVAEEMADGAYDDLPIGIPDIPWIEFIEAPVGSTITPTPTAAPTITQAKPCNKVHLSPGLGKYPNAPRRECPQGFHLNRVPLTPCFGWCVPN